MIEQCMQMMRGMLNMDMMMGGGMMGGMLLGGTLLLVAVVGMGVAFTRRVFRTSASTVQHTPLTILQERLARGEIGVEDYQQRRSLVHNGERGEAYS